MKNLLRIALCGLVMLAASAQLKAQSAYMISTTNSKTLDTVTNAGTRLQQLPIPSAQKVVSIQTLLVSKTGTPAGVLRLFGSLDGTTFVRIPSLVNGVIAVDSLIVSTTALTKIFTLHSNDYVKYRVSFVGSGTQSTTMANYAIWRN